jgi:hypothetical protein|nr:MAG TPA: hypothetical protein [Caudoviricetes sp.]
MATREGIYVGGKDIVERYVGDKLVWSKWIRIGSVRSINSPKSYNSTVASMDINGSSRFINHPRYGRGKTKKVKIVDEDNNSNVFFAKYAFMNNQYESGGTYLLGSGYYCFIEFETETEKNAFLNNRSSRYTFYIR